MWRTPRPIFMQYVIAVVSVAIVFVIKRLIGELIDIQAPFLLFFAAIIVSTWYGGVGSGVVAALLSALAADVSFLPSLSAASVTAPVNIFQVVLFFLEALLMIGLSSSLREKNAEQPESTSETDEAYALLDTFQVYAPVGLAFLDNDLRYVRINYAMAELNGLTPAAHIGRSITEVQPQLSPEVVEGIRRVLTTGKPLLDQELAITRPTMLGVRRQHLLTSYYRIRGADGKTLGVGAVMVDITQRQEAEAALRESEERFRVMADTAPVMIWMADANKACTYCNQVWLNFTGRTLEQELGSGWLDGVHPNDRARVLDVYNASFEQHEEFKIEYLLRRADGEYRWVFNHGVPRITPDGSFTGFIGSCIDITEREQLEANQRFLLQAGVMLASSLDYETTLANIAQSAVPTMGDWCAVDLLSEDGQSLNRLAVAHVDPEKVAWAYELAERYPVDLNAPTGLPNVLRTGKTDYYPEITEEMLEGAATSAESYDIMRRIGFTSLIIAPLIARGRTLGALTLVSAESGRHYTELDLRYVEELAARAALAVDNSRLYTQARSERERFRVTLSSIGDAVIATDFKGQVTFMNQVASNLTGWNEDQALGKPLDTVFNIVNEHSRAVVENPVNKVLREGRIVGLANHTVLIAKDGDEVPIDDSGAPIPALDGGIEGVVLVFRDVSERKRAEQRLQFLADASNLLISSLDYEETLQNVIHLAVPTLADWGIIYLKEDDGTVRQVAIAATNPDLLALRNTMMQKYPPTVSDDFGYPNVLRTGKASLLEVTEDVLTAMAADDEHMRILRQLGYGWNLSVPLKNVNSTFGVLTLATIKGERTLNEDDLAVVQELGRVASLAIENARLYQLAQKK